MSGGSWDYLYSKLEDTADSLMHSSLPERKAFGRLMMKCAAAMHDIEWVDSSDMSKGQEMPAIEAALGNNAKALILTEVIAQADASLKALQSALDQLRTTK